MINCPGSKNSTLEINSWEVEKAVPDMIMSWGKDEVKLFFEKCSPAVKKKIRKKKPFELIDRKTDVLYT